MKKNTSNTPLVITVLLLTALLTNTKAQVQDETGSISTHYVFPEFLLASVKMKDGIREEAMMNYNKLTEEMIFDKDGVLLALDSLDVIDTVYIESYKFVPHEKVFYEVVVEAPVSLYIQHKCNLLPAGNPSGYGGKSETGAARSISWLSSSGRAYKLILPAEFHITDDSQFWIRKENIFYKANTSSQIMRIFPDKSRELKQFIKQKKLDLAKIEDLISLVIQCNKIYR